MPESISPELAAEVAELFQVPAAAGATYTPPEGVQKAAARILKLKEDKGDEVRGGTEVGWARARQLASGKGVSADVVKRMANFFSRHSKNFTVDPKYKSTPWKDRGWTAFMLWGGAPGRTWSTALAKRIREGRA